MISELTYLILEVIAVTALLLFTLNIVISYPKNRSAWLFALFCLSNACYLLMRMSFKADDTYRLDLGLLVHPVQILMNSGSGLLMLFCFSLFQDLRRIPKWLLSLFGLQIVLSMVRVYFVPMELAELDRSQPESFTRILFLTMPHILQGCLGMFALGFTINGWSSDLVNSRRLFRWVCLVYFSVWGIGVMSTEIALPNASPAQRIILSNWVTIFYAVTACAMVIIASRVNTTLLDSTITKIATVVPGVSHVKSVQSSEADYRKFCEVFEDQQAYLQHGLSIGGLAEKMGVPQYRLRQLINSRLGYRNFNALLHAYRVKEACKQLSDPQKKELPVLTIALSLGYQSIAPFNQAFREIVGETPTGYRNSCLSGLEQAAVNET